MLNSILIAVGLLSAGLPEHVTDSLQPVTVTADKGVVVSRTDTLAVRNSFSISEILHQSPGIILGDYGGFAGLKTVSLRGFGSPHTSIYIDGVKVGNVQSGQNDLGMMGVENDEAAIIDYAQNSLSFRTLRPSFDRLPVRASVKFSGGSFGTWLPSARFDFRLSENLALSANAAGIISKGDFKYGDDAVRQNNDIRQVRAGLDLFGLMDSGDYHIKGYFNSSDRGTPGSVSWPSDDRQKDMNVFVQGLLRKKFSQLYSLQVSAKGAYDDIFYSSSWGDSRYGQTEFQLNSSHLFRINRWWNVSFAADMQWDGLKSTNYQASRFTASGSLTSSFRLKCLSANIALEYNGAFDSGARFAVAPGFNPRVVKAAIEGGHPFAPGVCTPSEIEQACELGCRFLKFFPAEAAGGVSMLKAVSGPYKHLGLRFMPTGGVTSKNAIDYLAIKEVAAVGGTWLGKAEDLDADNWDKIDSLIAEAALLAK